MFARRSSLVLICVCALACGTEGDDGTGETGEGTAESSSTDGESGTAETDTGDGDSGDGDSGDGDGSSGDGDGSSGDGDGSSGDGDGSSGDGDGSSGDGDGSSGDGDGSSGDGDGSSGDGDGSSGDGDGSSGDGDGSSGDGDGCVATETPEVSCDNIDNDCNGQVDDVDVGNDGFCDCLSIGILGNTGWQPTANFESFLQQQGTSVERTLLAGTTPDVVTDALLANYDVLLIDRIERALSPTEAAAIERFVKDDGNGMITLIGYNFDANNPQPERDRANSVLSSFGLEYQGPYIMLGNQVNIPTFDQTHPVSMGITDVNYRGGIAMADVGGQGASAIFATVTEGDAGLAHETANMGGRVIVWGDEWLTFDTDWTGFADVEQFWSQMVFWVQPPTFCAIPQ
jgi:hypothetical protein